MEAQRTDYPCKASPGVNSMPESFLSQVWAYGSVSKVNNIINKVCKVIEAFTVIKHEAIFFLDAIVNGSKGVAKGAAHGDSFVEQ